MDLHAERVFGPDDATAADAPLLPDGIPAEEVRLLLKNILRSRAFSMSKRCGDFLAYVVEQTLLGHQHELKERIIGVAVFGRPAAYDTGEDAIVRIKASETRRRLAAYYAEQGADLTVMLTLPLGGYVPQFARPESARGGELAIAEGTPRPRVATDAVPVEIPALEVPSGPRLWRWVAVAATALILALTLPAYRWIKAAAQPTELSRFWNPILEQPAPVFLVISSVPAYLAYANQDKPGKTTSQYVLTTDQYIGRGDMLAGERISNELRALNHAPAWKASDSIDMREMSNHAVVLIGYAGTRWGAMIKGLRFSIDDEKGGMVTDNGKTTEWYPHHLTADLHTDEDYAVVARLYNSETRSVVLLVSGGTQYGTEAAANLVTDGRMLSEALRDSPRDWDKGNVQLVLHVKVIGNTPAAPEVIAADFK
jgi:hypothetical protein